MKMKRAAETTKLENKDTQRNLDLEAKSPTPPNEQSVIRQSPTLHDYQTGPTFVGNQLLDPATHPENKGK